MESPSSSRSPPFPRPPNSLQATPQLPHEPYDDLYEGYNDYDQQLHAYGASSGQVESGESLRSKTDVFGGYDHVAGYSPSSSTSSFQGPKMNLFNRAPTPQNAVSLWRLPSAGRTTCAHSVITSAAPTDASRPLTAVRAAGYSSTKGAKFDPMEHQAARSSPFADVKKDVDSTHALKCHNMEHAVNQLLEASATAGLSGDFQMALQKAKEAGKKERALCKTREQAGLTDQINVELTFAVCFNLGYQYQCAGLQSEALNTYTQILKNKQFTQSGRLRVNMGNIYYKQQKYSIAIKMYRMALDQTPNAYKETRYRIMRNIGNAFMRLGQYQHDELQEALRAKQNQALKYILTAARLIAPVLHSNFVEGYDWVVEGLKDQHYVALANEMEMDKAIQHLHRREFVQAIVLLKEFEKKEREMKARAATNLSFLYFLEGDIPNAEKHAELAVTTDRYNAKALVNQGNCFYARGHVEEAKVVYREAVEVESDCVEAVYNLGLCQKGLGALEDALGTFKKLSNFLPNNMEVQFQVGHVNELMGNTRQAIKWLEIVNTRAMHDAGLLAMLGGLHAKLNDEPKALHYYSESHRAYPANMDITSWLGAYYVKNEIYEKAMPFFDLASKIQPTEVKWQLMVASCYRRTGAYTEALAKYKKILSEHPDNIECLRYLVHMYTSLGRRDEVQGYEGRLRQAEAHLAAEQPPMLSLEPAKGVAMRSIEYRRECHRIADGRFSPESSDSPGSSLFESRTIGSNALCSSLPSPLPQRTLRVNSKRKEKLEDEWPELGEDLLPMGADPGSFAIPCCLQLSSRLSTAKPVIS